MKWAIAWLVFSSLFYYAWWKPEFITLLVTSITVNAGIGGSITKRRFSNSVSRALLVLGITFNLGLLGYFKYAGFFVENINHFFDAGFNVPDIILPVGISFFTFQQIAYLFDAYRGEAKQYGFVDYTLFVTFFPQLIAGPIIHHKEMMPQFAKEFTKRERWNNFSVGVSIFCIGFFKKVVIADTLAVYADAGYEAIAGGHALDPASAWISVLSFSFQLYYDFSGYSDMAVGLARLFGICLPVNFHSPYKASSIIEFWRWWHITLSRFLRDYLYVPLGGNQKGIVRTYVNLAIVMLLGGLWHGANWTFTIWGGVHGCLLAMNHAWKILTFSRHPYLDNIVIHSISVIVTFSCVTLAWVPFRAENLDHAMSMWSAPFPLKSGLPAIAASFSDSWSAQFGDFRRLLDLSTWHKAGELWPAILPSNFLATQRPIGLLLACIAIATFSFPNTNQIFAKFNPVIGLSGAHLQYWGSIRKLNFNVALILSGMFVLSVLHLSRVSPFLYYQF